MESAQNKSKGLDIRQKAEKLHKKSVPRKHAQISESDALKLIHELEVHQIELELQNEELGLAKNAAHKATEKYVELYDYAPSGFFTLSYKGEIVGLNFNGAKMLGKERSNLINKRILLFISEETKAIFNTFLENIYRSKAKESCEVVITNNGNAPLNVYMTGIITENKEQCFVTAVDITEKKLAESHLIKLLTRHEGILASVPDIIMEVDVTKIYTWSNQAGYEFFGDDVIGQEASNYFEGEQETYIVVQPIFIGAKDLVYIESWQRRKDGVKRLLGWWCKSMKDANGKITGAISTARDITQQKDYETDLNKAKDRAEQSDHLKSAFLANMSHEIRTPMNGILGFAELLKEPQLSGEAQEKYIGIIEKSGERMLNIINDIIDISKVESNQMVVSISETKINEQIENLYNFFLPEIEKKGLSLSFKNGLDFNQSIIKTDKDKLFAILTNLIKNAIKFTHSGSIEFGYEQKGTYFEFYVKDTGIGLSPKAIGVIFERFRQDNEQLNQFHQGSGLGLTISKAYVEMLGGKIWVESQVGVGSQFYFTIPFNRIESKVSKDIKEVSGAKSNPQIKELKILIAEDEESSIELLKIILRDVVSEIIHVSSGADAVNYIKNDPTIGLILMDINMPEMNGYEATKQIREFNKEVIIISQTAYALAGDREKSIEAGCDDYISKPINKKELLEKIEKCLVNK